MLYDHLTFHVFISYLPNYVENSLAVEVLSHFFIVLPALALVLAHGKFFLESTFKALALITSSLHAKVREKRVRNSEKRKVRWWGKTKSRMLFLCTWKKVFKYVVHRLIDLIPVYLTPRKRTSHINMWSYLFQIFFIFTNRSKTL